MEDKIQFKPVLPDDQRPFDKVVGDGKPFVLPPATGEVTFKPVLPDDNGGV